MNTLQRQNADQAIVVAMGAAIAVWFAPVVSGVACNLLETKMVKAILTATGRSPTTVEGDALFWFFRKKYLLVNVVTYVPWVGTSVQLLEVYALGQFVVTCCANGLDLTDERGMKKAWAGIEPMIWSGQSAVSFYESNSSAPFPPNIRSEFMKAVEVVGRVARGINRIPGMGALQEVAGETVRQGIAAGSETAKVLFREASRTTLKHFNTFFK